jgi:hypothetical protein
LPATSTRSGGHPSSGPKILRWNKTVEHSGVRRECSGSRHGCSDGPNLTNMCRRSFPCVSSLLTRSLQRAATAGHAQASEYTTGAHSPRTTRSASPRTRRARSARVHSHDAPRLRLCNLRIS